MTTNRPRRYRGKYPTRIHSVGSTQSRLGLGLLVVLNNGDRFMVRPLTAQGRADAPLPGRQIGDYIPQHYSVMPVIEELPASAPRYILRAFDVDGREFYYTGKAGAAWVSPNRADAFEYGRELAWSRRDLFNGRIELTGLSFVVVPLPASPHTPAQNCHGQTLPVDARGWPAGTEAWSDPQPVKLVDRWSTLATPRGDLPATMEYGDPRLEANQATASTLDSAPLARLPRFTVKLIVSLSGYEIAGSACRWTDGYFAVRYRDDSGATQGRRFLLNEQGEADARALFATWTTPQAPVHSQAARDEFNAKREG